MENLTICHHCHFCYLHVYRGLQSVKKNSPAGATSRSGEGTSAVMSRPVLPAWLLEVAKCDVNPLVQRCQISKQMVTNKKKGNRGGKEKQPACRGFLSTRRYLYGHLIRGEMQVQCSCQEDLSNTIWNESKIKQKCKTKPLCGGFWKASRDYTESPVVCLTWKWWVKTRPAPPAGTQRYQIGVLAVHLPSVRCVNKVFL